MARAGAGLEGPPARLAAAGDEGNAVVRLAADPQGRWAGVRAPARLEVVNGRPARGTVLVVTNRAAAERLRLLEAGESAVLLGRFRSLEAGEQRWRWRHVGAVFEAHDLIGAGRAEPAVLWAANGLRHRVLAGGEALDDTDRALVAGFLVGDDRDLPPRVASDFRAAGLSHLLVVSGANVTLALAVLAPLLRNFGLLGRLLGGVAGLTVFCAMTRFEPSVLRAGAMSGLALVAAYVGRPAPGLRVLALTVAGLLLVDPFLLHSLGFGLSCGASAGILLLAGPFARRIPGPRFLRGPLAVTAAAQVGVAPVALPAFGQLPLAALPANLLAAPAAAALSVWGLGSGLVGGLVDMTADSPGVGPAGLLQAPTAALAGWIRFVAGLAARFPITIGLRPTLLGAAVAVLWWRRYAVTARLEEGEAYDAVMPGTEPAMAVRDWERLEDPPGQRMELVSGQVTVNPAPRLIHQHVVRLLTNALADACGPDYLAVFDGEWRIPGPGPDTLRHARRPDVVVATVTAVRGQTALLEAPLVVVEVLSPGNRKADISEKRALYFEHGAGHYVEVAISDDEREVTIKWCRRGPLDWVESASARGDAVLEIDDPFHIVIRPNGLLF